MIARLERLERLAGLDVTSLTDAGLGGGPPDAATARTEPAESASSEEGGVAERSDPEDRSREAARTGIVAPTATPPEPVVTTEAVTEPAPHAADAGSVDVAMLRRGWPSLIEHLGQIRQPILRALLESATVATFDGTTLELAFPPDKRFGVQKVADRQDELQGALGHLFGIRPAITCVVRESREPAGGPAVVELVDEEDTPTDEEALRRVQEMLGAQLAGDVEPA